MNEKQSIHMISIIVGLTVCLMVYISIKNNFLEDIFDIKVEQKQCQNQTITNIFTDNMKDCQEKGGEYSLELLITGEVLLEKCYIPGEVTDYAPSQIYKKSIKDQ